MSFTIMPTVGVFDYENYREQRNYLIINQCELRRFVRRAAQASEARLFLLIFDENYIVYSTKKVDFNLKINNNEI